MSATFEEPTTVRALAQYVESEHPDLSPSYHGGLDQLLVVGQPGKPEPPTALREILGRGHFAIQDEQVTGRSRWVAIINPADGRNER